MVIADQAVPADYVDGDMAERFLHALGAERCTFQTFDDKGATQMLARILHGSFEKHAEELVRLNAGGAGVFVTINETDGAGRSKANITCIRALMLDLDDAPLGPVRQCRLKPHIIVETSPGRHQCIYRVKGFPLDGFEDTQRGLAKRFDGDPAVATLERCARLPGFFHNKGDPLRTRIVEINDLPPYTEEQVLAEFPPMETPHGPPSSDLVLPAGVPVKCACEFIRIRFMREGAHTIHHYRGGFYEWLGTHYKERDAEYVRSILYGFLNKARALKDEKIVPFNPTPGKVNAILDALRAGVYQNPDRVAPFWLPPLNHAPAEGLIACRNGLLDYKAGKLIPHNPRFFNVNALPFDYASDAPKPERWHQFLLELWPDDKQARLTLQRMFGLMLTSGTSFQKIFMLVGPKRSGKGTIGHVLTELLGRDNVANPTMASLCTQFGLWPLIDKQLAIVPDARLGTGAEARKATEQLLSVSGEDRLTIDRKHKDHWTGKLGVRFLILTNELPRFADASGALASRFVILTLRQSFYGREELDLKEKLQDEMPGILNWSLRGLDRLMGAGYFKMPKSSMDAVQQMEDLASPVAAFVRERCELRPNCRIGKQTLFHDWKNYCGEQGLREGSQIVFGRNLIAAFPEVRAGHSGSKRFYQGVTLIGWGDDDDDTLGDDDGSDEEGFGF